MTRLLIIDDDYSLFALLSQYLEDERFSCRHAADGGAGLALLADEPWDMVVLDIMLPVMDGFEILRRIRENPDLAALPVLMLSARGDEEDKVSGLDGGADDYLAKPFGPKELAARLKALQRRAARSGTRNLGPAGTFRFDDLAIHKPSMRLMAKDRQVELTASEMRLLEILAQSPGQVVERNRLSREVLGHPPFPQDRSLDMLVSRLRKKLGPRRDGGERIRSARGEGYALLLSGDTQ